MRLGHRRGARTAARHDRGVRGTVRALALLLALVLAVTACASTNTASRDAAPPAGDTAAADRGAGSLSDDGRTTTGGASTVDEGPVDLGPTDPRSVVHFSVVLRLPGEAAMKQFLKDLNDPRSPEYRHYLAAAEFGARFGLPEKEVDRVEGWLRSGGLRIVSRHPQRTTLGASGTAAQVEAFFGVRLREYRAVEGNRYRIAEGEPRIPDELRGAVAGVTGLSTDDFAHALFRTPLAAVRPGGLRPPDVAKAFEIEPLHAAGLHGEGQTIAIVSFDTFLPEDVAAFDAAVGIQSPPVEKVKVAGGIPGDVPGDGAAEVNLDIDIVRGIAPAAQILNYEAPNGVGFAPVINEIVGDGRAGIISNSWGACEARYSPIRRLESDTALQAAAAAGITMFVASGDAGAYDCRHADPDDLQLSVDYPSVSPFSLAVGGTYLSLREDGSYLEEAGWEEPFGGDGTGGGLSRNYDRPAWQTGPGVDNQHSNGKRQVPDVAGPADCDSAFFIVYTSDAGRLEGPYGCGTSAAAPFFSASMLLILQLAERENVGRPGVGRLGFMGPMLYDIAEQSSTLPAGTPRPFNDVLRGGNLLHDATPGWDYATGLGSPRVNTLAQAVIAYLRNPPG